jgi:aryl-alcohol dehydrogenase-like predicted oxidoreductase
MEVLAQQGKVIYVGSSNFAGWHIAKANEMAKARHFLGLVSEQAKYNLTVRTAEMEVIPACRDYGMGLIPWSPLASGLLAGAHGKEETGRRAEEGVAKQGEKYAAQLSQYEAFCEQMGEKPADVALAWLWVNPVVTAPIVGPRKMEQLTGSLRALEIKFSQTDLEKIDEIWPGPGGESPEAFAW